MLFADKRKKLKLIMMSATIVALIFLFVYAFMPHSELKSTYYSSPYTISDIDVGSLAKFGKYTISAAKIYIEPRQIMFFSLNIYKTLKIDNMNLELDIDNPAKFVKGISGSGRAGLFRGFMLNIKMVGAKKEIIGEVDVNGFRMKTREKKKDMFEVSSDSLTLKNNAPMTLNNVVITDLRKNIQYKTVSCTIDPSDFTSLKFDAPVYIVKGDNMTLAGLDNLELVP